MTAKDLKRLQKLRKWKSDLDEEGLATDLKLASSHHQRIVKIGALMAFQLAMSSYRFGADGGRFRAWMMGLLSVAAIVSFWQWHRYEKLRTALEEELVKR